MVSDREKSRDELIEEVARLRAQISALRTSQPTNFSAEHSTTPVFPRFAVSDAMPPRAAHPEQNAPRVPAMLSSTRAHRSTPARHAPGDDTQARRLRRVTEELRASEERYRQAFEQAAVGIAHIESSGRMLRVNQRLCDMVGYEYEELLARSVHDLMHPDEDPLDFDELGRVLVQDVPVFSVERRYVRKDKTSMWVNVTFSHVPERARMHRVASGGKRDASAYFVAVIEDITVRKQLERQKEEFLSIASHELKTPLTSLKMLAQITRRRLEAGDVLDVSYGQRMERAVDRMERLVNDLLDVSRIESGKVSLRLEPCDLVAICRLSAAESEEISERSITLHLPIEPICVNADAERIGQVVTNLLSNALKYSGLDRRVTLSVRGQQHEAVVTVEDEGGGIPGDSLPHLFELFYRVPGVQVQSGSSVGLGLGLFISREIIERHGGRISARSHMGVGCTFSFRLPLLSPPPNVASL